MSLLLQVKHVTKRYGVRDILTDANFTVSEKQRIGMFGRNGAGKSTIFKMIIKEDAPDSGEVIVYPETRIGYLEQEMKVQDGERALAFLMRKSGKPEWECAKLASKFEMREPILEATVASLSGGYRTRLALVALLLADPNLLLLDEPTNYLDLRTQLLLEQFLNSYRGAFLVISHDREFLKRTCAETLEVADGKTFLFPGDIESYLEYREEQHAWTLRENKKIERERKHLQDFVDRFRFKASKASQAQSKIKQLERLKTIEIGHALKTAKIIIPHDPIKKGLALTADALSIGYKDRTVAASVSFSVYRGEHVGIVGDNGQGKSTLLKTIAGELAPVGGEFKWGHGLSPAYYAQHTYELLDVKELASSYLKRVASPDVTEEDRLRMAGNLLFKKEDLDWPIGTLSGGERARLCLAGLLLGKKPVLMLDEPTNHLDLETIEALGEALREYPGTVFFVSHNRTFANLVATTLIEVRDGNVKRLSSTYAEYVGQIGDGVIKEEGADDEEVKKADVDTKRKELKEQIDVCRKQIRKAENAMSMYESEKQMLLSEFLISPAFYSRDRNTKLVEITTKLQAEEEAWLKLQGEAEALHQALEKLAKT